VIEEVFKHGADGYLIKSEITPEKIVKEVNNVFEKVNGKPSKAS
jgi:hypothetical protein